METYENGTIIKFSDGRHYGVVSCVRKDDKKYVCLATISDPLEVLFAEVADGELRVIKEQEEKESILSLFAETNETNPKQPK